MLGFEIRCGLREIDTIENSIQVVPFRNEGQTTELQITTKHGRQNLGMFVSFSGKGYVILKTANEHKICLWVSSKSKATQVQANFLTEIFINRQVNVLLEVFINGQASRQG